VTESQEAVAPPSRSAILDEVLERLIAEHTADANEVVAARRDYEDRRGRVFQEEELWERWSAAFVEWFVIERVAAGAALPPAARSLTAARAAGSERDVRAIRAWLTSHRSLFEVCGLGAGHVELLDLLGGAMISVSEPRAMHGVSIGDVAELRVIGFDGDVVFGRTFVFHPPGTRDAILAHARRILGSGGDRRAVLDHAAALRIKVERYRHMPAAKVYELAIATDRPGAGREA
jgi:hypothetical protein